MGDEDGERTGRLRRALERGSCTLIVARTGPVDANRDVQLLDAIEQEADLPAGTLCRTSAMEAREFRLLEGVSRRVADRVARAAATAGFVPRVRNRLGIRWSSERGTEMAVWFAGAWVLFGVLWALAFPFIDVALGAGARVPVALVAIPILAVAMGALYRWQLQKLYLPLVVSSFAMPQPVSGPLSETAHDALDSVGRLGRALDQGALPDFVVAELSPVVQALRSRVRERVREARAIESRTNEIIEGLHRGLVALPDDAPPEETDRLSRALVDAERSEAERDEARTALGAELIEIRRVAALALAALESDDPDPDLGPIEQLRTMAAEPPRNSASNRPPVGAAGPLEVKA